MICSLNSLASFSKLRSRGIANRLFTHRGIQDQLPLMLRAPVANPSPQNPASYRIIETGASGFSD